MAGQLGGERGGGEFSIVKFKLCCTKPYVLKAYIIIDEMLQCKHSCFENMFTWP